MVSPWPPSTKAWIPEADTPSASAMKNRMRAESSTPAMPSTRSRGKPLTLSAVWAIASSGLLTMIRIAFGLRRATCSVTDLTISKFFCIRSSRLMPGLRGRPEVITTMSEPAVSS
jgi:hypothetical protein